MFNLFYGVVGFVFYSGREKLLEAQADLLDRFGDQVANVELDINVKKYRTVPQFILIAELKSADVVYLTAMLEGLYFCSLRFLISAEKAAEVPMTLTYKARNVAVTNDNIVWREVKNWTGSISSAKYTLEEIKRIYQLYLVNEERIPA